MNHYCIQNNDKPYYIVSILNSNKLVIISTFQENRLSYEITRLRPDKIWLGNSCVNEMTEFSGEKNDPLWNAYTILLELEEYKYMFIGEKIYTFTTNGDKIIKYISSTGNNCCAYPVAYGENNIYLLGMGTEYYINHDKITDEKILKRIKDLDESFQPYGGLVNNLYELHDDGVTKIYIGSENKFDVEKLDMQVIHNPYDDLKMWYNPGDESFGNELIGGIEKLLKNGLKDYDN